MKRYGQERDPYEVARRRMVQEQLISGGIRDERVLAAMGRIKRHEFVNPGMASQGYEDRPLQIGMGQTISQPLIVAMMTEALALKGDERVLEIGTGSGYQTAILAELAKEVFTIERIADLSVCARKALHKLLYKNINFRIGDGTVGWPEKAPFDKIIVTAASPKIPGGLIGQLREGGTIVIPVGAEFSQELLIAERTKEGLKTKTIAGCRFVKLVGEHGWGDE